MYAAHDWTALRLTHARRPVRGIPHGLEHDTSMPERTPVVGDLIRYIDGVLSIEISPMSAMGYLKCGRKVDHETYEVPE